MAMCRQRLWLRLEVAGMNHAVTHEMDYTFDAQLPYVTNPLFYEISLCNNITTKKAMQTFLWAAPHRRRSCAYRGSSSASPINCSSRSVLILSWMLRCTLRYTRKALGSPLSRRSRINTHASSDWR